VSGTLNTLYEYGRRELMLMVLALSELNDINLSITHTISQSWLGLA